MRNKWKGGKGINKSISPSTDPLLVELGKRAFTSLQNENVEVGKGTRALNMLKRFEYVNRRFLLAERISEVSRKYSSS